MMINVLWRLQNSRVLILMIILITNISITASQYFDDFNSGEGEDSSLQFRLKTVSKEQQNSNIYGRVEVPRQDIGHEFDDERNHASAEQYADSSNVALSFSRYQNDFQKDYINMDDKYRNALRTQQFQRTYPSGHASFVIHDQPNGGYLDKIPQNLLVELRIFANQLRSSPLMNAIFNPYSIKLQTFTNNPALNNYNYVLPSPRPTHYQPSNDVQPSFLADDTLPEVNTRRLASQESTEVSFSAQDDENENQDQTETEDNSYLQRHPSYSDQFNIPQFPQFPQNPQMNSQNPQMNSQNPQMDSQNPQMNSQNPQMDPQNPQMSFQYPPVNPAQFYQQPAQIYQQPAQTYQQPAPIFPQPSYLQTNPYLYQGSPQIPPNLPEYTLYTPYSSQFPIFPSQPTSPNFPENLPNYPQIPQIPSMLSMPTNPPIPLVYSAPGMLPMPLMQPMKDTSLISEMPSEAPIPTNPPMPDMPYPSAIANSISQTMKQYISPSLRPTIPSEDGLEKNIDVRFDKRIESEIISQNTAKPQLEADVMQFGGINMNLQSGNNFDPNGANIQTGVVQLGTGLNTNIKGGDLIPFEMPEFVMPTIPPMIFPGFIMPKFEMPKFEMPKFKMPKFLEEEDAEYKEVLAQPPLLDDSTIPNSMEILSQMKGNVTDASTTKELNSTTSETTTDLKQLKRVVEITTISAVTKKSEDLLHDDTQISPESNNLENNTEIDLVTTMESITEMSTLREDNSLNDEENAIEETTVFIPSRIDPNVIRTLAG